MFPKTYIVPVRTARTTQCGSVNLRSGQAMYKNNKKDIYGFKSI